MTTRKLLIRATGYPQPGQLAAFGQALASSGFRLLDFDQRTGPGVVSFEALIDVDEGHALDAESAPALLARHVAAGLSFQAVEVDATSLDAAGSPGLILTLLAPHLAASSLPPLLAGIERLGAASGLSLERVSRLSGRTSLGEATPVHGVCFECGFAGVPGDPGALRREALALGAEYGVDIAVQEETPWRHQRRLICFDMDSTLIKAEVIDELARCHGVFDEVAAVTERAMRGELDFQQSFRERMQKLEGLDESVLEEIADNLEMMDGLERLMTHLKRLGYKTAIISGGFTWFARYLQKRFGFDEVHANELVIDKGQVTGRVVEPIVDAERKAQILGEIAARHNIALAQTVAVGDGANDLKMLEAAGLGIAFRAKPLVREQARLSFSRLGLDGVLYLLGHRDEALSPFETPTR